jgi:hypothetical protein
MRPIDLLRAPAVLDFTNQEPAPNAPAYDGGSDPEAQQHHDLLQLFEALTCMLGVPGTGFFAAGFAEQPGVGDVGRVLDDGVRDDAFGTPQDAKG